MDNLIDFSLWIQTFDRFKENKQKKKKLVGFLWKFINYFRHVNSLANWN